MMKKTVKMCLSFVLAIALAVTSLLTTDISAKAEEAMAKNGDYIGVKTEAKVYDDFENDIWLQYQQKELDVGETAEIYPWRTPQIVSNSITNDVARPNFHFDIIKGEDVISLEKKQSNSSLLEENAYDKAIITAEKQGTAIVQVTYDKRTYVNTTYGAISPVNTGYVVFTVGETGKAQITTDDKFANWLHYDTIYYNEGETTPYSFKVDTENAISVKVTVNGMEVQPNGPVGGVTSNTYTANLENRSNIIGIEAKDEDGNIKSMYRIIDARFIEVNVKNKTTGSDIIESGNTAVVSFKGVTMPVYKLATIYNPQMGKNATYIQYENEQLGEFKGQCRQWDLATNNDFEITFNNAGSYEFISDGIHCAWWGSKLGTDMGQEGAGNPNLNAPTLAGTFSSMPTFKVNVLTPDEADLLPLKEKVKKEVNEYKNLSDYRAEQKEELKQIISEAEEQIKEAKTKEEIESILMEAKSKMDAIKTDAQLTEEEQNTKPEEPSTTQPTETQPSTTQPVETQPTGNTQTPAQTAPVTTPEKTKSPLKKAKVKKAKNVKKGVKLSWKKVKGAKKYQIFRSASKNGKYKKIAAVSKKKLSYVDKKVKQNKKYFYKIRSFKIIDGKKVFSSFSKVIAVRVK